MMTLAEFLAWEETQPGRHEFVRGEVFAMVGARRVHGIVSGNVFATLRQQLRGTPCQAFTESMKLKVADDVLFYPDVFVTCDPADLRTDLLFRAPTVVVEVLSDSTQSYDRGQKFTWYRRLPSLQEYLLVDVDRQRCELFRKGADGLWVLHPTQGEEPLQLASLGLTVEAEALWADLEPELPAPAAG